VLLRVRKIIILFIFVLGAAGVAAPQDANRSEALGDCTLLAYKHLQPFGAEKYNYSQFAYDAVCSSEEMRLCISHDQTGMYFEGYFSPKGVIHGGVQSGEELRNFFLPWNSDKKRYLTESTEYLRKNKAGDVEMHLSTFQDYSFNLPSPADLLNFMLPGDHPIEVHSSKVLPYVLYLPQNHSEILIYKGPHLDNESLSGKVNCEALQSNYIPQSWPQYIPETTNLKGEIIRVGDTVVYGTNWYNKPKKVIKILQWPGQYSKAAYSSGQRIDLIFDSESKPNQDIEGSTLEYMTNAQSSSPENAMVVIQ
jgi:hypothetical protein